MKKKNQWYALWQNLLKHFYGEKKMEKGNVELSMKESIEPPVKENMEPPMKERAESPMKSVLSKALLPPTALPKTTLLTESVESFLKSNYDFRYNILTEETEFRSLMHGSEAFSPVNQRVLNTLCLEAHEAGISCWDRDIVRYVYSTRIVEYHPFKLYLEELPA